MSLHQFLQSVNCYLVFGHTFNSFFFADLPPEFSLTLGLFFSDALAFGFGFDLDFDFDFGLGFEAG